MSPDVLLVILDTARADAFRPWGGPDPSPTIERLCSEGTWFEQAIAPAPWTLPSTASILSGVLPSEHGVDAHAYGWRGRRPTSPAAAVRSFEGPWVPDAMRDRGYRTLAVSCNPWVSTWAGFDRGFDRFADVRPWPPLPTTKAGWAMRRARQMSGRLDHGGAEALRRLAGLLSEAAPRPTFALVNLMEMHAPYDPPLREHPLARGVRTRGHGSALRFAYRQFRQTTLRRSPDQGYVAAIRDLYRAAARHADRLLGRLVRLFLERAPGPAVVVVVSDHGENLGDHGLFTHHSSLHESLLRVPLVVWGRGVDVRTGVVREPAGLLGLAGWIVAIADGGDGPPSLSGPVVSEYESTRRHMGEPLDIRALRRREGPEAVPALVEHAGVAIRDGSLKYVALDDGRERLFDLAADPLEAVDLLPSAGERATAFRPMRDAWLERIRALERRARPQGGVVEGPIADHLRSLGYIE